MAGKRLLDVVALVNASRGVARNHIALRQQQVDVYHRTSTLARAVRNQTERLTETAKAASFLISKLNESEPEWMKGDEGPVPSRESTEAGGSNTERKTELDQDHFYEPSSSNSAVDAQPKEDLDVKQEKANRYPLPDGTIPPVDALVGKHTDQESFSTRPQEPAENHLEEGGLRPESSGASTIPIPNPPSIPHFEAVPEQEQIPEGINTDLFYSPRVAKLLGGKSHTSKPKELKLQGVNDTPIDHTNLAANKDQDTFNVRTSSQKHPGFVVHAQQPKPQPSKSQDDTEQLAAEIREQASIMTEPEPVPDHVPYQLRESKVPSSRLGRIWNYTGLAAGMFGGAVGESLRRVGGGGGEGSFMLSAANMDRLVTKLSRMRGAALKLGQMISFQDSKMLPPAIQQVLQRVQDRADYMPASQRNKVLAANLGEDWRELFSTFTEVPIAAASIGQVHRAVLKSTGIPVAVKVQYPGVADSIDSDLNNLAILLTASRLLPAGLFLDKTIANARTELAWECDYVREAECGRRFQELLADETDIFVVPKVFSEASGPQVLTMEFLNGVGVTRVQSFSQEQKDWIGTQILRLCLREITEFRFMQTDPNWTNFLFNAETNKLELLDFGASREYPEEFIDRYTRLLEAASRSDKQTVRDLSIDLGYLTGKESKAMLDAHIASVLTLAEPFLASSPEIYDFKDQTITDRVKALIPVMIKERLAPPPEETYSLHRKLSGAFLLCARLGSRVKCRELFQNAMKTAGIV